MRRQVRPGPRSATSRRGAGGLFRRGWPAGPRSLGLRGEDLWFGCRIGLGVVVDEGSVELRRRSLEEGLWSWYYIEQGGRSGVVRGENRGGTDG